jgi:hypothetical protein
MHMSYAYAYKQKGSEPDRCTPRRDHPMYDARLATTITTEVDRRLRMLALIKGRPLNHVLVGLLDEALPTVGELASLLGDCSRPAEPEAEAAA